MKQKRIFFMLLVGAMVLATGCAKVSDGDVNEPEMVQITITADLQENITKALADYDGYAVQVNHWVLEVRDANGNRFTRQERENVAAGTLTQSFTVSLFKNGSYSIQIWADTKGTYNTDDLTAVSIVDTVANRDTRDAFSANMTYTSNESKSITATLHRPFAQLNIITTDLDTLWQTTFGATDRTEYDLYTPDSFKVELSVPVTFNVMTQSAGNAKSVTLVADSVYKAHLASDSTQLETNNNYYRHINPATLFMDYIFAGTEKAVVDMDFSFRTNGNKVNYSFSSVPLQRNYRTNIKGNLLSNKAVWIVTIDPVWTGEHEFEEL